MKKLLLTIALLSLCSFSIASEYVSGYYKKDGTYVQGYYRSSPNSTVRDNYSYKDNYNPHTGEEGDSYYRNSPSSQYYRGSSLNDLSDGSLNYTSKGFYR